MTGRVGRQCQCNRGYVQLSVRSEGLECRAMDERGVSDPKGGPGEEGIDSRIQTCGSQREYLSNSTDAMRLEIDV